MITNQVPEPRQEAHQTGCLPIDTKDTTSSLRIGFTDQRLSPNSEIQTGKMTQDGGADCRFQFRNSG